MAIRSISERQQEPHGRQPKLTRSQEIEQTIREVLAELEHRTSAAPDPARPPRKPAPLSNPTPARPVAGAAPLPPNPFTAHFAAAPLGPPPFPLRALAQLAPVNSQFGSVGNGLFEPSPILHPEIAPPKPSPPLRPFPLNEPSRNDTIYDAVRYNLPEADNNPNYGPPTPGVAANRQGIRNVRENDAPGDDLNDVLRAAAHYSGPAEPHRSPSGVFLSDLHGPDTELGTAHRQFNFIADTAASFGMPMLGRLTRHFLDAAQLPRKDRNIALPSQMIRSYEPVQEAAQKNRNRFVLGFQLKRDDDDRGKAAGTKLLFENKLKSLRDGDTIDISDHWDRDPYRNPFQAISDRDYYLAFKSAKLKSSGDFSVTRRGQHYHIDGDVLFEFEDTFNFDNKGISAEQGNMLQIYGLGAPFDIKSSWRERVTGSVQRVNGKFTNPQFQWIEQPD